MTSPIHVMSEIGKLKTVMLKRPNVEVENFTPDMMERLLFDDIPYLPIAQQEHFRPQNSDPENRSNRTCSEQPKKHELRK